MHIHVAVLAAIRRGAPCDLRCANAQQRASAIRRSSSGARLIHLRLRPSLINLFIEEDASNRSSQSERYPFPKCMLGSLFYGRIEIAPDLPERGCVAEFQFCRFPKSLPKDILRAIEKAAPIRLLRRTTCARLEYTRQMCYCRIAFGELGRSASLRAEFG